MHSPSGNGHATEEVGKPTSNGGRATLLSPVLQTNSYLHDDGVTANRNQPDAGPRGVKTWHKDIGTGILPDTAILHVNIRGLRSRLAELESRITIVRRFI